MELAGRSAIVTGGAGGLGSATVRLLVDAGMHVVIVDRLSDAAAELANKIGGAAMVASGDVNNDDDVEAAIATATSAAPLGLVVNVAGGGVPTGRTVGRDGTPHDKLAFITTMEMNVFATFNMTRLAAAAMGKNEPDQWGQRGVVVNVASIAGYEGQTGQLAYATAKAAILGMSLPLARDLAPMGIRVCAIAPGTMGTPAMMSAPREMQDALVKDIIFPRRMGRPEEFAMLVESIARNPYLNGENVRLDGALRFAAK